MESLEQQVQAALAACQQEIDQQRLQQAEAARQHESRLASLERQQATLRALWDCVRPKLTERREEPADVDSGDWWRQGGEQPEWSEQ